MDGKNLATAVKFLGPNVPLLRAAWSLLDGIWGVLKGGWGVLEVDRIYGVQIRSTSFLYICVLLIWVIIYRNVVGFFQRSCSIQSGMVVGVWWFRVYGRQRLGVPGCTVLWGSVKRAL